MSFASMMIEAVSQRIGNETEADLIGEHFAPAVSELAADPAQEFEPAPVLAVSPEIAAAFGMESLVDAGLAIVNGPEADQAAAADVSPAQLPCARFIAPRKALADALKIAESACLRRSIKPILQAVKISINGTVQLGATNSELTAVVDSDWAREGEASILVSPKRLGDALKLSKAVDVEIKIDGGNLLCGPSTIPAADNVDDFPPLEYAPEELSHVKFPADEFVSAWAKTEFATDQESSRYALGGVLIEFGPAGASFAATDSRRLSVVEINGASLPAEMPEVAPSPVLVHKPAKRGRKSKKTAAADVQRMKSIGVIVPYSTMKTVAAAVKKHGKPVCMFVHADGGNSLRFEIETDRGRIVFNSPQIEGRFPDYRRCIPNRTAYSIAVDFDRDELLNLAKLAKSNSTDEQRGADFTFNGDTIGMSQTSTAGTVRGEIASATSRGDGEKLTATFDPRYLAEFLESIKPGLIVTWRLIDGDSAAVFDVGSFTHIVMPLSRDK